MISRSLLRVKILQVLYSHISVNNNSIVSAEKSLTLSLQHSHDLYHKIMLLPVVLQRYANDKIEAAKLKRIPTHEDLNPNTRFIDNQVIKHIAENPTFNQYISERKITWIDQPELIAHLYNKLIEDSNYLLYMTRPEQSYKHDKDLVLYLISTFLDENQFFYGVMEDQSIFWNDDIEFMRAMVGKSLQQWSEKKHSHIPELFHKEEDKEFAFTLLRTTLVHFEEYLSYIEKNATNWDVDRLVLLDNIIIQMAINEAVVFPSIPLNVTFDEYLEISKYYSTPKSAIFINGILDKIISQLREEGKVHKIGRSKNTPQPDQS